MRFSLFLPFALAGGSSFFGESCSSRGGYCADLNFQACDGSIEYGLCGGGENIKCCIPGRWGGAASPWKCSSIGGTCVKANTCGGTPAIGICPGDYGSECCVPEFNRCAQVGGSCIDTGLYQCSGGVRYGLCPGGNDIRCCDRF